jgi:intracellular septation protein A
MGKLKKIFSFVFGNFGPLVVFYAANHFCGLMTAIAVSFVFSLGEIAWKLHRKEPLTMMFKYTAAVTLVFGCVDLGFQRSVLFKYEAALTNVFTGIFFASTLRGGTSIIEEAARKQVGDKPFNDDQRWYFRRLTMVWVAYFFLKAAAYAWLASLYSIEKAMAIRAVAGNVTLYGLMGISMFGSRPLLIFMKKHGLLPSQRGANTVKITDGGDSSAA